MDNIATSQDVPTTQWAKSPKKQSSGVFFDNMARTPSDCLFGDFAHLGRNSNLFCYIKVWNNTTTQHKIMFCPNPMSRKKNKMEMHL